MLAVNYWIDNDDSNSYVAAFDVRSLSMLWKAGQSLANDLAFTPDGEFTIESNIFAPFFYWRSAKNGRVVRQGAVTSIDKITAEDCSAGGQIIKVDVHRDVALLVDFNDLLGPSWRTHHMVVVRELDLQTGKCKDLFSYQGSFDLFDVDSGGRLLAYGGVGSSSSIILWNLHEQSEMCRIPKVNFGRFVPRQNTLAVVREQYIAFFDTSTCHEIRRLDVAPAADSANYFAISPDGKQLAIAHDSIEIIDAATGETLSSLPFPAKAVPLGSKFFLSGLEFSPDGRYLSVVYLLLDGTVQGEIQLWRLR